MKTSTLLEFSTGCLLLIGLVQSAQGQTTWSVIPAPRGALPSGEVFTTYVVAHNESFEACEIEVLLHDGGGNLSDPDGFRIEGATTTNPFPVNIPSFEIRELAITNPEGFSSGALTVNTSCPPAAAGDVNVFGRYEVFRLDPETGDPTPREVFPPTPGPPLVILENPPNPYVSAWIDFKGDDDSEAAQGPPRNLGIAWASRGPVPEGTRLYVRINNQNQGKVVGPISIPIDGSFQSQFISEIPGWPENSFSEPFQGRADLTLDVPDQQSVAPVTLDVQFISVVGSGTQFQFSTVQHIILTP